MSPRAVPESHRVLTALAVVLLWLVALIWASWFVLPRLRSADGLLEHVPLDDFSLTLNQHRLELEGARWQRLVIDLDLAAGEQAYFLLERDAEIDSVLRLGRESRVRQALLRLGSPSSAEPGRLVDQVELPCEHDVLTPPTTLRLERRRGGTTLEVRREGEGGESCTVEISVAARGSVFEVGMFPPDSTEIHRAIRIGSVAVEGGGELRPRPLRALLGNPAILLMIVLLPVPLLHPRLPRLLAFLFPYLWAERRKEIVWTLLALLGLLAASIALVRVSRFPFHTDGIRLTFRIVSCLPILWAYLFLVVRDRLLANVPRARDSLLFRSGLVAPAFLLSIVVVLTAFAVFGDRRRRPHDIIPTAQLERVGSEADRARVACYGGSSTRGYPFPDDWEDAWPRQLEARLRSRGGGELTVWNFGADSADLFDIAGLMERTWPAGPAPTHVIVDSIVNNKPEEMGPGLRAVSERARGLGVPPGRLILVMEPVQEFFREEQSERYDAMEKTGGELGALVLDPRPLFRDHRDEFLFLDTMHLTGRGHRLLAEFLAGELSRKLGGDGPRGSGSGP